MDTIAEVAVAEADAATRAIYQRIMQHSGTGTPALIFRHFAVHPGFLDWTWRAVGGEIESGRALRHAMDAVARAPRAELPAIGATELAGAGIDAGARRTLDAILTNYNRMNPMNFGLIAAIRQLISEQDPGAKGDPLAFAEGGAVPAPCPALPPPADVRDLPDDLRETLTALSAAIPDSGVQVVPTLYRHLAIWPDLLRLVAPGILAAMARGEIAARMAGLRAEMAPLVASVTARVRAKSLPPPPLEAPERMVRTLDSFLFAIPQMIVVGEALEASMPPGAKG